MTADSISILSETERTIKRLKEAVKLLDHLHSLGLYCVGYSTCVDINPRTLTKEDIRILDENFIRHAVDAVVMWELPLELLAKLGEESSSFSHQYVWLFSFMGRKPALELIEEIMSSPSGKV